jgi:hypothetical protein
MGNNGFYIPSCTEAEEEEAEQTDGSTSWDDVNVEW